MKRIVSILLTIALCISFFTIPAFAAPKIKVLRSYQNGYTNVTVSCSGYTLYYTTDGSKPDSSDKKYTGKLKITKPLTLRVAAYKNGSRKASVKAKINVRVKAPAAELIDRIGDYSYYYISVPNGATVYATFDGSTPSKNNGERITENSFVEFYGGGEIKLAAYKKGWKKSKVRTVKVEAAADAQSDHGEAEDNAQSGDFASEVLRLVNIERSNNGLAALEYDETLQKAAQVRADELVKLYSHDRPDGSSCFTVLDDFGITSWASAENIAAGYASPADVVEGWMNSPGHRANILSSKYKYLGVGIAYGGEYGIYWSQLFTS